ncbi:L-glutaminase [Pontibacter ummariensis]|uniref:Glutaminase n=1 Tax=Pontibacter ummariensis TaxID=1610492 RepID=A0A239I045_9BACT|nr:glutaminase [Pontibacter ummariensis]PRY10148.1 L-glutaminase [Pontibacter ummariensis]SNS86925.1 L-glutaminase [Pontibacter ummariensis]
MAISLTNYQKILDQIQQEISGRDIPGRVASYIPELAKVPADKFGMHLYDLQGESFYFGDNEERFSIQSISKVFSLALAMKMIDHDLWKRVGVEPSGARFNSLSLLEDNFGIPRNPFINAGALVVADVLISSLSNPKEAFLTFLHELTGDDSISYNETVAASEKSEGYRNVAMVNYLKSFGNIRNDVEEVLDFYFHQCAVAMSCKELSKAFLVFANQGKLLNSEKQLLTGQQVKRINALMQTCGFYDEAGEFSFEVGLPGKSGVGGGIVAVHPNHYAVAVWSPPLNPKGNSARGMAALERLTTLTGYSIF